MDSFAKGELTISVDIDAAGGIFRLDWRGKSNERDPAVTLQTFFGELLSEAAGVGGRVEMHFENIDHCNSATLTALIQLIQKAQSQSVPVALIYDPERSWQRIGFSALRMLEKPGLTQVREVGYVTGVE